MTWDGYKDERKMPPKWYSATERWFYNYRFLIFVALYFFIFFVTPFFDEPESIDPVLIDILNQK